MLIIVGKRERERERVASRFFYKYLIGRVRSVSLANTNNDWPHYAHFISKMNDRPTSVVHRENIVVLSFFLINSFQRFTMF